MKTVLLYAGLISTVTLMGALVGAQYSPGTWYVGLAKPWFTPPRGVFHLVWPAAFVIVGWVGARKLERGGSGGLWILQLALNFAWAPVFFGLHMPAAALVVAVALLGTILAFVATEWRDDRVSALLFVPYAVWVGFACVLNVAIVSMN